MPSNVCVSETCIVVFIAPLGLFLSSKREKKNKVENKHERHDAAAAVKQPHASSPQ